MSDVFMIDDHGSSEPAVQIRIDGSDHFDIIHVQCGYSMDIRTRIEYTNVYKKIWFEIRCVVCGTPWRRWRKAVPEEKANRVKK